MATKAPKLGVPVNQSALSVSDESPDAYEGGSYVPLAPTAADAPPEPSGLIRRVVGDTAVSALKGIIGVPEAAVGLADLASGGQAGKVLENSDGAFGFRPKQAKDYLDQFYSPEQQAAFKRVQGAANPEDSMLKRVADIGVAAVKNPSTIAHSVVESVPAMLAGGVLGRGAMMVSERIGAGAAGAIGEGLTTAGQNAEQVRQETKDGLLTGQQSAVMAASGALTGGLSMVASKVAKSLGVGDIDTLIVGGKHVDPVVQKSFVRKTLEGAFTEGVLEELPQSVQEQVAQNYALGKPLDEGVDQAVVMGTLSGSAMGVGAQAFHGKQAVPNVGPMSRAANIAAAGVAPTAPTAPGAPAAPTAPAAPAAPIVVTPQQEQELLAHANERKAALDLKAKGVKASEGVEEVQPQFLTPAENGELKMLAENGGDVQALARTYGPLEPKQEPAPIADPMAAPMDQPAPQPEAHPIAPQAQDAPAAPVAPAAPEAPLAPAAQPEMTAFEVREQDRPVIGAQMEGDIVNNVGKPFLTVPAAMNAQREAGDGFEIVPVQTEGGRKGLVVRRKANYQAPTAASAPEPAPTQPAAASEKREEFRTGAEQGDVATVADILESDILNPVGAPFKEKVAAIAVQKKSGGDLVKVAGGWVVRLQPTELGTSVSAQPTGTRGMNDGDVVRSGSASTPKSYAGDKIDDEWTAFTPETGTLGKPRAEMPQVRAEHRGAMVNFLNARGITHETGIEVDPKTLKPTQAEFSPAKVQKAVDFGNEDRSILVSSDNHVLDGHHQWIAKLDAGQPVKVIRLNAPIARLLEEVSQFPSAEVSEGSTSNEPTESTQTTPEDAPEGGQAPTPTGGDAAAGDAAGSTGVSAEPQAGDDEAAGVEHAFKVGDSVTFSPSRGTKGLAASVVSLQGDSDVRIKLLGGNELTVPHDFLRAKAAPEAEPTPPEVAPQPPVAEPPAAEPTGGTPTGDVAPEPVAPKDDPVEEPTEEEAPVAERPDELIELRRELSVLNKLKACLKS